MEEEISVDHASGAPRRRISDRQTPVDTARLVDALERAEVALQVMTDAVEELRRIVTRCRLFELAKGGQS